MARTQRVTLMGYGQGSAHYAWRAREEFNANDTLRGEYVSAVWGQTTGRLNADESARLISDSAKAHEVGGRLYVVFSYATPIAWVVIHPDGTENVYRVSQKFSVTTSKHQGRLY